MRAGGVRQSILGALMNIGHFPIPNQPKGVCDVNSTPGKLQPLMCKK